MNSYAMKIQWINPIQLGFLGFTTFVFLWERIRKKSKQRSTKKHLPGTSDTLFLARNIQTSL